MDAAEDEHIPTPITVTIGPSVPLKTSADAVSEEERKLRMDALSKLESRAKRFGLEATVVTPVPGVTVPLERKIRRSAVEAAPLGFDLFDEEQIRKREERAQKFGLLGSSLSSKGQKKSTNDSVASKKRSIFEEDEETRRKRAERFGVHGAPKAAPVEEDKRSKKQAKKWKLPRVDPTIEAEQRPDSLYLHGCDSLKTNHVFGLFKEYSPVAVEWINDSSCVVTFADSFAAKRVVHSACTKEEGNDVWYTFEIGRSLRIATFADVKPVFFDEQTPEERAVKQQLLTKLATTVGKKKHQTTVRKVFMGIAAAAGGKPIAAEATSAEEGGAQVDDQQQPKEEQVAEAVVEEEALLQVDDEEEIDVDN